MFLKKIHDVPICKINTVAKCRHAVDLLKMLSVVTEQ